MIFEARGFEIEIGMPLEVSQIININEHAIDNGNIVQGDRNLIFHIRWEQLAHEMEITIDHTTVDFFICLLFYMQ